jgi:glycine/D-amino acid oxidase-like deaminating enzyme
LQTRTPVLGLLGKAGKTIGVVTTEGQIHADVVVLAAGSWSTPIAGTIGISLGVEARRLTIGRILLPPEVQNPMTFLDGQYDTSFRPEDGQTALISMRDGRYGQPIDPDRRIDDVDPAAVHSEIDRMARRMASAARFVGLNTWTSVDGFTPDFKGIYGEHHECRGLFVE